MGLSEAISCDAQRVGVRISAGSCAAPCTGAAVHCDNCWSPDPLLPSFMDNCCSEGGVWSTGYSSSRLNVCEGQIKGLKYIICERYCSVF